MVERKRLALGISLLFMLAGSAYATAPKPKAAPSKKPAVLSPALEKIRAHLGLTLGEYALVGDPGPDRCSGGFVTLRAVQDDVILTVGASNVVFSGLNALDKRFDETVDDCKYAITTRFDASRRLLTSASERVCGSEDDVSTEKGVETMTLQIEASSLEYRRVDAKSSPKAEQETSSCRFRLVKAESRR